MKTLVYIVDDHPLLRRGLREMIDAAGDMEVCGEGDDCETATQDIIRLRPDVAVVDISFPGNSGLQVIKNIKALDSRIMVLVLSVHDEAMYALSALKAGAKGYVMKHEGAEFIIAAVRKVARGHTCVNERVSSQMLSEVVKNSRLISDSPICTLSERELDVASLIGAGFGTREIAVHLHVSVKTVETHRAHIKVKANVGTSIQLVQFCVRFVEEIKRMKIPLKPVANFA